MATILIATDFSPAAGNAVEYGVHLAKFFDARIVLVNAYPVPATDYETGFSTEMINSLQHGAEEELEKLKKEICEKYHRDFEIECTAQMGFPKEVLLSAVQKYDADMVVLGITGHAGKIKEHIIGSTAIKSARHLEVPVFIIPEHVSYKPIRKIAFACDLERTEESDIVYITKYFANIFDSELEVIYIEKPLEELSVAKSVSSQFVEKKLESVKHKTVYCTDKDTGHGLRDYFKEHPADLIIVNPKKHSVFHNLFHESVTKELAFHSSVPILTIH